MSRVGNDQRTPRAIIHKNILDVAESNPDATLAEVAAEVGGATVGLAERVLEEYGDPAAAEESATPDEVQPMIDGDQSGTTDDPNDEGVSSPSGYELSDRQEEILRLVLERPHASQGELADDLDISRVTVSRQLNDIPEFQWKQRREFARRLLNADSTSTEVSHEELEELRTQVQQLKSRLDEIEEQDRQKPRADDSDPPLPPELVHKAMHACMASETFSDTEELELMERLLGASSSDT